MGVVLGKDIYIFSGTSSTTAVIAGAKSCTIHEECETREKASSQSATAKEFVAGRTSWEVSISHLVVTEAPFAGLIKVGTSFSISVAVKTAANTYVRKTGTVICTAADMSGAVGTLGSGQVKLLGTGELATPSQNG
jgi:hypothetical protein